MSSQRKIIPTDSLLQLRQRLDRLPPKSPEHATQITAVALLYGVCVTTVYRTLRSFYKPHTAHRRDHGKPRILPPSEPGHYCELIAALKLRTTNKAGRHLSTTRAIQLPEEHSVETAQGLVKLPQELLRQPTVNRYLSLFRFDHPHLLREPPNGPVAKSHIFQNVMQALHIDWQTHMPAGKDGTRTTARSKGKVERPFRTVKEAHETLYHFHKPETEQQANEWLWNYTLRRLVGKPRHGAQHRPVQTDSSIAQAFNATHFFYRQ